MSKETRTSRITVRTGICWGLICIIPFGWVFFLASIVRRKNDVIKYGTLNAELALIVLHNYIVSYTILFAAFMIICVDAWSKGRFVIPSLIAAIGIPIVYNVVVGKILDYEEEIRGIASKKSNDGISSKLKTRKWKWRWRWRWEWKRKRKNSDHNDKNDMEKQLKQLKEYSRKLTNKIEQLEKTSRQKTDPQHYALIQILARRKYNEITQSHE